jgi:hypothetical protein
MLTFISSGSVFLMMSLMSACASMPSPQAETTEIRFWNVQIKTSGGFAGVGNGAVSVSSDGTAVVTKPVARGATAVPCKGQLKAAELKKIRDAISQSKPDGWKVAEFDVAAPDAFGYVLTLQTETAADKREFTAIWYDNTFAKLPTDLKYLTEVINSSVSQVRTNCP